MNEPAKIPYKTIKLPARLIDNSLVGRWELDIDPYVLIPGEKLATWGRWRDALNELSKALARNRGSTMHDVWSKEVSPAIKSSINDRQTPDGLRSSLGRDIFNALFNNASISAWNRCSKPAEARVRLVFEFDDAAAERMARVPLEGLRSGLPLLNNAADELALAQVSIVRRIKDGKPLEAVNLDPPMRVLVFAPNPADLKTHEGLDVEAEMEGMRTVEKESSGAILFTFVQPGDATFARLANERGEFHVFHFCGHGDIRYLSPEIKECQLLFENQNGKSEWRPISEVIQVLLKHLNTRLVVLNGCETAAVSVFAKAFPAVVGMQFRISDTAARLFADGFYRELAVSGQLDDAVWMARDKMNKNRLSDWPEHITPVLYMNSEDGLILRISPKGDGTLQILDKMIE